MIYTYQGNCLFVHVSRTAGSSISNLLYHQFSDTQQIYGQHDPIARVLDHPNIDLNTVYSFAVVRNPWERLVSWYNLINSRPGFAHQKPNQQALLEGQNLQQDFEMFVENWLSETWLVDGVEHRRASQYSQLCDRNYELLVNQVCRFESLNNDITKVIDSIGIKIPFSDCLNASTPCIYQHYYNAVSKDMVTKLCADDIENFSYQF